MFYPRSRFFISNVLHILQITFHQVFSSHVAGDGKYGSVDLDPTWMSVTPQICPMFYNPSDALQRPLSYISKRVGTLYCSRYKD